MDIAFEDIGKLLLALLIGGLIGAEREYRDKAAGFRTMIFICVGSTLFTMFSLKIAHTSDPARIAAQIVTGVGFLGGGAILRDTGRRVMGLTTAATIWLVAALGMGVGAAYYEVAGTAAALVLVVLWFFPTVERWIDNARHNETYEIVTAITPGLFENLDALFQECGLQVHKRTRTKSSSRMISTWQVRGSPQAHGRLAEKLFAHEDVQEFRV